MYPQQIEWFIKTPNFTTHSRETMRLEPRAVKPAIFFPWIKSSLELMMRKPVLFILLSVFSVLLSIGIRKAANIPALYSLYFVFMVLICRVGVVIAEAADKGKNPIPMIMGVSKMAWLDLFKVGLAIGLVGFAIAVIFALLAVLAGAPSFSVYFQVEPYESTAGYLFIEGGRVCRQFATGVILFSLGFLCLPALLINLNASLKISLKLALSGFSKNTWIAFLQFPFLYVLYHFIGFYVGFLVFVLIPFIVCFYSNEPMKKSTTIAVATAHRA